MTLINAYAKGSRGYILTDTSGYDADGVVVSWINKVMTIPHLSIALTSRGASAGLPVLVTDLSDACPSFDALITDGAEVVRSTYEHNMWDWVEKTGNPEFDLIVVGWSTARQQCEGYALSSLEHEGRPSFQFWRQDVLWAPAPPVEDLEAARIMIGGRVDDRDPRMLLLRLATLQRDMPSPIGGREGAPERHIVGGQLVLTEIGPGKVSQSVVHTWPDTIGETIDPSRGASPDGRRREAPALATVGLSRQQRRQMEREQRRARVG